MFIQIIQGRCTRQDELHPVEIIAKVGRPIDAARLTTIADDDSRVVMDAVGLAIAELLPPEYRGAYHPSSDTGALTRAARVLAAVR